MRYYDFDKTTARRELKKRNYLFYGVLFGAIPGFPILISLLRLVGFEGALTFIVMLWMVAWITVAIWRMTWICPRCHNHFFFRAFHRDAFGMRCLHCGLRPDELI